VTIVTHFLWGSEIYIYVLCSTTLTGKQGGGERGGRGEGVGGDRYTYIQKKMTNNESFHLLNILSKCLKMKEILLKRKEEVETRDKVKGKRGEEATYSGIPVGVVCASAAAAAASSAVGCVGLRALFGGRVSSCVGANESSPYIYGEMKVRRNNERKRKRKPVCAQKPEYPCVRISTWPLSCHSGPMGPSPST
jgi:hypothetical protein